MGIIGSADGPTAVIVTGSPGPVLLLLALLILGSTPLPKKLFDWASAKLLERPALAGAGEMLLVGGGMVLSVAFLVDASYNPFLYFRF